MILVRDLQANDVRKFESFADAKKKHLLSCTEDMREILDRDGADCIRGNLECVNSLANATTPEEFNESLYAKEYGYHMEYNVYKVHRYGITDDYNLTLDGLYDYFVLTTKDMIMKAYADGGYSFASDLTEVLKEIIDLRKYNEGNLFESLKDIVEDEDSHPFHACGYEIESLL